MATSSFDSLITEPVELASAATTPAGKAQPAHTTERVVKPRPPLLLEIFLIIAIVIVGAVITVIRVPAEHLDVVWAEDGNIFLFEQLGLGTKEALLNGYAGYQHAIPRIVAAFVVPLVPLEQYAVTIYLVCSVLTGLVAAAVYWLSRDVAPWVPARVALALITVLIPLSAQEVTGNLADFHSYCMWLAPWLLIYRPRNWYTGSAWGIVMLLCAATEIQTAIFGVLILFMLHPRNRHSWPVALGLIVGIAAQLATMLGTPRTTSTGMMGTDSLVAGYLINAVYPFINPDPYALQDLLTNHGYTLAWLVLVPFLAAAALSLVVGSWRQRLMVLTLAIASIAIYAGSINLNYFPEFDYATFEGEEFQNAIVGLRYGVVPAMFLAAAIPLAAAILATRGFTSTVARVLAQICAWVMVLALVVVMANASTQTYSVRDSGGSWSAAVAEAREQCERTPQDSVSFAVIAPANRKITLKCSDVLAH